MHTRHPLAAALLAGALLALPISSAHAQQPQPHAPAPSAQQLTVATNALMRPGDLPQALDFFGAGSSFETGYTNPPGGQDPFPVCQVPGSRSEPLYVPADLAVGFSARIATENFSHQLVQDVYQYPDAQAAGSAWNTINTAIPTTCSGTFRSDGSEVTLTATRIPGLPDGQQGWGIAVEGAYSTYTTVHVLGDAIQLITYTRFLRDSDPPQGPISPAVHTAINGLAGALAGRWVARDTLPITQPAILTQAASSMLQPADVPSTLPIGSPAQGAWSNFTANTPANPLDACRITDDRRVGAVSFNVGLGSDGGPMATPGVVGQIVHHYPSPEQARAAWESYSRDVAAKCSENATGAVPWNTIFERVVSGVSPLTFNGTPGLWYRYLTTNGGRFASTTKSYTIVLLVGSSIQQVS